MQRRGFVTCAAMAAVAAGMVLAPMAQAARPGVSRSHTVIAQDTTVDALGNHGRLTALVLDSNGDPAVGLNVLFQRVGLDGLGADFFCGAYTDESGVASCLDKNYTDAGVFDPHPTVTDGEYLAFVYTPNPWGYDELKDEFILGWDYADATFTPTTFNSDLFH